MRYIVVRTYGNGKYMNKVYPILFEYLSQAQKLCNSLNNSIDKGQSEIWTTMPLITFKGEVW